MGQKLRYLGPEDRATIERLHNDRAPVALIPLQAGPNSDPQEKPPPPEKTMHPGPETDRGPPQNSADPGTGNFITVGTAKALCRVEPLR